MQALREEAVQMQLVLYVHRSLVLMAGRGGVRRLVELEAQYEVEGSERRHGSSEFHPCQLLPAAGGAPAAYKQPQAAAPSSPP